MSLSSAANYTIPVILRYGLQIPYPLTAMKPSVPILSKLPSQSVRSPCFPWKPLFQAVFTLTLEPVNLHLNLRISLHLLLRPIILPLPNPHPQRPPHIHTARHHNLPPLALPLPPAIRPPGALKPEVRHTRPIRHRVAIGARHAARIQQAAGEPVHQHAQPVGRRQAAARAAAPRPRALRVRHQPRPRRELPVAARAARRRRRVRGGGVRGQVRGCAHSCTVDGISKWKRR